MWDGCRCRKEKGLPAISSKTLGGVELQHGVVVVVDFHDTKEVCLQVEKAPVMTAWKCSYLRDAQKL